MEYRRCYQSGARYFFTVVTENRKPILIDNIERLRAAFRLCLSRYPFAIEAIVVLSDHLHTLWKLPEGDLDFSRRWMVIKRKFSSGLPIGAISASKAKRGRKVFGNGVSGIIYAMRMFGGIMWIISTLILLNMVMCLSNELSFLLRNGEFECMKIIIIHH